jgi:hypothetical protein
MKSKDLHAWSIDQLVSYFAELSIEQDTALLRNDIKKVNRLFDQLEEAEHVLKTRDGDQRRALLGLYDHPNMNARVNAAKATLAVAPKAARTLLEDISKSKWQPQAGDAGMCLTALDRGIFKPT